MTRSVRPSAAAAAVLLLPLAYAQEVRFVLDLRPGSDSSSPHDFHAGWLWTLFAATAPQSREGLYRSDGTAAGTVRLRDMAQFRFPTFVLGGRVLFAGEAGPPTTGLEPWITDGTSAGTVLLKDIRPGSVGSNPFQFTWCPALEVFVFAADDGVNGNEPWRTDGTPAGTFRLADLWPGSAGSDPGFFTEAGGRVYFFADDGVHGREPWVLDGAGPRMVHDVNPTQGVGSVPEKPVALGRNLVFFAHDGVRGKEPWVSDGTPAGTRLLRDIAPGFADGITIHSTLPRAFDGRVWFRARDFVSGEELWSTDGTPAGTVLAFDLEPGARSSNPSDLAVTDAGLFFAAETAATGREPWFVRFGSSAPTVHDLIPGASGSNPAQLTGVGRVVYFAATSPLSGRQVPWKAGTGFAVEVCLVLPHVLEVPHSFTSTCVGVFFAVQVTDPAARPLGVELGVIAHSDGLALPVGPPCGLLQPSTFADAPVLGGSMTLRGGVATPDALGVLGLDAGRQAPRSVLGCGLYLEPGRFLSAPLPPPDTSGAWRLTVPVPNDPLLLQADLVGETLWIRLLPALGDFSVSPPLCFTFGR